MKTELKVEDIETKIEKSIEKTEPVTVSAIDKDGNKVYYIGSLNDIEPDSEGSITAYVKFLKEREIIKVKRNKKIKEKRKKEWELIYEADDENSIIIYKGEPLRERFFIYGKKKGYKNYILTKLLRNHKISLSDKLLDKIFNPQIEQIMEHYKDHIEAYKKLNKK